MAMNRSVLLIRFEHLQAEMTKILRFLLNDEHLRNNSHVYQQRIHCIFKGDVILPRSSFIHREKVAKWENASLYLSKQEAYSKISPENLCKAWKVMQAHMVKYDLLQYGYGELVGNYNCHEYG